MSNRLPVFDVFRNSFRYMLEHYRILSLFCIFSFLGIYMLGGFNLADNLLGGAFYLLYTYLFYFIFVWVYFNRQKLFSKPEFINALVRIITISLLAFASLMLLETAVLFFLWLLNPLEIYPHIREMWTNFIASNTFRYALYGGMFLFLTVIFYIPALAWVSAVIGRNASITLTFFHTKDNYLRIFLICFIVYGLLPFVIFMLSANSWLLRAAFTAIFTVVQCVIYLHIYEFFYKVRKHK